MYQFDVYIYIYNGLYSICMGVMVWVIGGMGLCVCMYGLVLSVVKLPDLSPGQGDLVSCQRQQCTVKSVLLSCLDVGQRSTVPVCCYIYSGLWLFIYIYIYI